MTAKAGFPTDEEHASADAELDRRTLLRTAASRAAAARYQAIVAALAGGVGQREVARATGLSHTGIAKIAAGTAA